MIRASQNWPERVQAVRDRLAAAAARCGRNVTDITLLAVSKAQPVEALRAVAAQGVEHFGASYLNEALGKLRALEPLGLTWHFIGRIQANKTRPIAEHFAWVHSVDRLRIAERLSAQRPVHAAALNVCIQVNLAGEQRKAGVAPAQLPALAEAIANLPRLRLRGLMCIPPPQTDPLHQRAWFARLRELRETLNNQGAGLDTLSMGMSADFENAVLEGATIVRIGTALFGPRQPPA